MSDYAAGLWSLNGDGMVIVETFRAGQRIDCNQYAVDDVLYGAEPGMSLADVLRDAARHGDADWTIEQGDGTRYIERYSEATCLGGYQSSTDCSDYQPPSAEDLARYERG